MWYARLGESYTSMANNKKFYKPPCLLDPIAVRLLVPPWGPETFDVMGLSGNLISRRWPLTVWPCRAVIALPALLLSLKFTNAQNFSFSCRTLLT